MSMMLGRRNAAFALILAIGLIAESTSANADGAALQAAPTRIEAGMALHDGVTFEANLGLLSFLRLSNGNGSTIAVASVAGSSKYGEFDFGAVKLPGLNVGIGGWIHPRVALTVRIAWVRNPAGPGDGDGGTGDGAIINAFLGPAGQIWVAPRMWVGAGVGVASYRLVGGSCINARYIGKGDCSTYGLGLNARAGYSFGCTKHTFNVSLELNSGFYSDFDPFNNGGDSGTATGLALLAGYQFL